MRAVEQGRRPSAGDRIYVDGAVQQVVSATEADLWLCDAACVCRSFDHDHTRRPSGAFSWDPSLGMFTVIEEESHATNANAA